MSKARKTFRIELNNNENVQVLLQETYDEACKNIASIQTQMNKLQNSVSLNDEAMDAKTKYAKAMNDFIVNMDRALKTKMDIAKLMADIIKNENKGTEAGFSEMDLDWDNIHEIVDEKQEYKLK